MKQRLEEEGRRRPKQSDADHIINPSFDVDDLGTDELANIVGFIPPEDIMRASLNKKMRETGKRISKNTSNKCSLLKNIPGFIPVK